MKELLEKNVFSHITLTDNEYFSARSYFKSKKLKRLEILHSTNVVCNNIYFIESGIIRYYQMNDGKEVTGGFFLKGSGMLIYLVFFQIVILNRPHRPLKIQRYFLYLNKI